MDSGMDGSVDRQSGCEPGATASAEVAAMGAALRRHAAELEDIRRHALSVTLLSWESPAGGTFRTYLSERCTELSRTIDLLDSAARELGAFGGLVRDAEVLQRGLGL